MPDNTNHIPKIMGILNVTPDSFFPDSRLENISTNDYKFENADILDIYQIKDMDFENLDFLHT